MADPEVLSKKIPTSLSQPSGQASEPDPVGAPKKRAAIRPPFGLSNNAVDQVALQRLRQDAGTYLNAMSVEHFQPRMDWLVPVTKSLFVASVVSVSSV